MAKMRLRKDEGILEFGGKEFHLKPLDLNDMIDGEEEHGLNMTALAQGKSKLRDIRTLFYLVINKANPEGEEPIDLKWVGAHIDLTDKDTLEGIINFIAPGGESASQDG